MSRARSAPPELPGFTVVRAIGGGGFADVFLYEQHRPNRAVAVKVLRSEHLSDESLRQFENEADVMAEVSAHPYIVTIYSTGVAPDGRPYIVMEHYSQPHFGTRAIGGRLTISEVLRVGVQVSSAVETAHRAGILHRDIKPANILTSAYGRPGLTDFGIAGVRLEEGVDAASGVSIAFASPETLSDDGAGGSVASDVYSLSATLYALLAGRSPRWIPGGDNTDRALLGRALSDPAPRLSREDAPSSLANLLLNGLSFQPDHRPASALALAHGLQDVEQELRLAPTHIEVQEERGPSSPVERDPGDEDGTRRASAKVVHPEGQPNRGLIAGPPSSGSGQLGSPTPSLIGAPASQLTSDESPAAASSTSSDSPLLTEDTILRGRATPGATGTESPAPASTNTGLARRSGPMKLAALVIIGVILVSGVGIAMVLSSQSDGSAQGDGQTTTTVSGSEPGNVILVAPQAPSSVTAALGSTGTLVVSFTPPNGVTDGPTSPRYRITRVGPGGQEMSFPGGATFVDTEQPRAEIPGFTAGESACVEVSTVLDGRISDPSAPGCASAG